MIAINPMSGLLVPLQGTLAGDLFAARNAATPAAGVPAAAAEAATASAAAVTPPEAVARLASAQGGLAPLFADLGAAAMLPDLPQAVQVAARAMLSLGLDARAVDSKAIDGKAIENGTNQADLKLALLSLRNALRAALPEGARVPALPSTLPPPHRAALPVGEQPALPSILSLDSDGASLKLLSETDAALARTTLLQLASLPETSQGNTTQRLVVDIPIATPQGYAVIQLQVEPDKSRNTNEQERQPSWRIMLALDIEPLGPVRATVTQIDGRTHVSMFAEREASARALRDGLPALQTQLSEAALETGDLNCRSGTPQHEAAAPGLFVDRAS